MSLKVLIIEDDPLVAMTLEDMALELGHDTVGPVATLPAAERAALAGNFDLVIADLHLGGSDTYALCEELLGRRVPVVLSTGYDDKGIMDRLPRAILLLKPFSTDQLDRAIQGAIQRQRPH